MSDTPTQTAHEKALDYTRELLAKEKPAIPYLLYFPSMREVAREHGYALGIHGSMHRDFDLIAAPWTPKASSPEVLVEAICAKNQLIVAVRDQQDKPHGRRCWTLKGIADMPHGWVDISVMPPESTTDRTALATLRDAVRIYLAAHADAAIFSGVPKRDARLGVRYFDALANLRALTADHEEGGT